MKIALIQISTEAEQPEKNLGKIKKFAKQAKNKGAKIVVFHEASLSDYVRDVDKFSQEVPNGLATQSIIRLAKKLDIFISFGLIEKDQDKRYITQVFIGPEGFIYKYRKTWLYYTKDKNKIERHRNEIDYFDPGSGPNLFQFAGLKCACIVCCDGNSKKALKAVKRLKPELVFFPNNREEWRVGYRGNIARFIGSSLLVINRVGTSWGENCCGGCSAYLKDGTVVSRANENGKEEILIIDTKDLIN